MGKPSLIFKNALITCAIQCTCFVLCLFIQIIFRNTALIPSIFVLGSFLTSFITEGYTYGIISAVIGVFAVNFAFTFPYFRLNFTIPENLVSAVIMIIVSIMTCALTTKLKQQEAMKAESERERMRANLLRAISHDLRTPLTTIYGASSAILENSNEFSDEQKHKMLQGISQEAEWLSRMVENLLSITRLDSGNVKIIKTPTVLDELIDSVLIKFNKRYPNRNVAVNIPDEFVVIPMDALLIEQVLINILENAVQHAERMTELSLKVYTSNGKAFFEIRDNGAGISAERLKNLFSGGSSHNDVPPDRGKGNMGIGLSVCRTIVKAHDGDISAVNLKEGGALFRFSLNMEDSADEQQI